MSRLGTPAAGTLSAAVWLAIHGSACAADPVPMPALDGITVVGKLEQPVHEVAASVSVLRAADIEMSLATDLRALLRAEPGLAVSADPHRFGNGGISIRGLGGNRVHLETDGVPAPSAFAIGSYSDASRPLADLEVIERIEILRGPASSIYGSDALAGVVATTTRNPDALLTPGEALSIRARSGHSGRDDGWFGALTLAGRMDEADMLLAWGRRTAGSLDVNSEEIVPNPRDAQADTLMLRARWLDAQVPLRLTASWERQEVTTQIDSLELTPGRFRNTTMLAGADRSEILRVILDQQATGWLGLDQAVWRIYAQRSQVHQDTAEERRAAPPRTPPLAIQRQFRYEEQMAGGEVTLARQLVASGGTHWIVTGVEADLTRIAELREGLQTDLDTGQENSVILGEDLPVRDFPKTRIATAGAYLQDDFRPGDGAWSIIPALRLDWSRLTPQPDEIYRADNPVQVPVTVESRSLSPKLGLSWRPTPEATVYLQYSGGFRAPPFEDVNIGLDLPQFNVRAIPNPDLAPERSESIEAGAHIATTLLSATASVYYSRYRDFIESKVNLGPDPDSGTVIFQSQNIASAVIQGAEASLTARLPAGWSARIAAAYARGDDTANDVPLDSIEPLRGVLSVRHGDAADKFSTELLLTATAAKRRIRPTETPVFLPSGWMTADVTVRWRLTPWIRLDAGVFNLTDRSYFDWSDVRGRPADDPLLEYYRRPGRNWSIALTAEF